VNIFMWLLVGAAAGWMARSVLDLPVVRTLIVSVVIAIVGMIFGGDALAPIVRPERGGVLSPFTVLVACVSAIACLKVVRMAFHHFQLAAAIGTQETNPADDSVMAAK
jgi:uncharacterized membrane protein YeaQ/YmgE (transglycosylase-associated protein family)